MRRAMALLLGAVLSAGAFGGLLAVPRATGSGATPSAAAQYGPHLMLPDPTLYPKILLAQPSGWTGTSMPGTRAGSPKTLGIQPVLVLLVDFTDQSGLASSSTTIRSVVTDTSPGARSVANYYKEASYDLFGIQATATGWYHSNYTMGHYGNDTASGYDDANGPIYRLVTEAVRMADPYIDFHQFDGDGDGVVDHLIVVHAGDGEESDPNQRELIWSHRWSVIDSNPGSPGDQPLQVDCNPSCAQIYGYSMDAEFSPVGVFAHELGHDLGLPDLYDTDGSSDGIGVWDVMGTGSWNGSPRGTQPAGMTAWSKIKLGWIAPTVVTAPRFNESIPQVETNPVAFKLAIGSSPAGNEYFLVENRQRTGFDASLPAGGILIWHVDDSEPDNTNDVHRLVDLVEADGNNRPTQATDPWSNNPTGWGPDTTPNSNSYLNQRTGWKVRNIGPAGSVMTADLSREVDDDLVILGIHRLNGPMCCVRLSTVPTFNVTVGNRGARPQQDIVVNLTVYRGSADPANVICCGGETISSLAQGATANLSWDVAVSAPGKFILEAHVPLALDEVPENNRMYAHFNAGTFHLLDDVESGINGWGRNGGANDAARWEIDQDGNDSVSHSPEHAWRFGQQPGGICLLCPDFHTLTSGEVNVSSGPVYLYFWHRFDLYGRMIDNFTNSVESDVAFVNVTINGAPRSLAEFSGARQAWEPFFFDLTPFLSGPTNISLTLSASSKVVLGNGGWWVDDIALSPTPLSKGLVARAIVDTLSADPGGVVSFRLKVANVGDFDDTVAFALQPPAGWTAAVGQNDTLMQPYDQFRAFLRPDADASLFLAYQVAADAPRGSRYTIPVTVSSRDNSTIAATFDTTVVINDPFGLAGLEKYVFLFLIVLAAIIVIAVVIDAMKKQRGVYRRW